jgi:hypothetical protein
MANGLANDQCYRPVQGANNLSQGVLYAIQINLFEPRGLANGLANDQCYRPVQGANNLSQGVLLLCNIQCVIVKPIKLLDRDSD